MYSIVPLTEFLKVFIYRKGQMMCGFAETFEYSTFELI